MRRIYLDFNSTGPLLPEVVAAMAEADAAGYANPASQHSEGRRAHRVLEDTREEIALLLGADLTGRQPDRLIFTSGGTEANNLALLGTALQGGRRIMVSSIEHPSIKSAGNHLAERGWQIDQLQVTHEGDIDLDSLNQLFLESHHPPSALASVMLANNETGVIQQVGEIARRCQAAGVPLHTDAAQAVGKMHVDFRELGVAAMTIAPHKFGGPRGIGALVVQHGVELQPILHGGTQQLGMRPGTESITLPIGFLAALRTWERKRDEWVDRMRKLRDRFESTVRHANAQAVINGSQANRLPHVSNISFGGHDRQALFMALDLAGVCCSTGSACASGSSEPSATLLAMNLKREVIESSLRFSLGPSTTADEVDEAARRLAKIVAA